jgi:2-polyprenyl-3-methyl-5-hydroxy-6-metoxy-1,4-benzoquinol methylase
MPFDNLEEYADPALYDLENQDFEPDGPFFLALAQRFGSPVLELGCGTGRITIPLAQQGIPITGLDLVPEMLARAKTKPDASLVEWVEADARSFNLGKTFRLIIETGSLFQHQLERADQEAVLARVRDHLEPGGTFVLGTMFPHIELLTNEEEEKEWFSYENESGQEIRVTGTQVYDPLRQIKTETAYRRWTDSNGQEVCRVAPLQLRFTFPQELEMLLHYNGFVVIERYGSMDFSPLTSESQNKIYVCQKG